MLPPVNEILQLAVRFSKENRAWVRSEQDDLHLEPRDSEWVQRVTRRQHEGACVALTKAGGKLLRLCSDEARPFVKRAAKRLCDAVRALGTYRPEYVKRKVPLPAGFAETLGVHPRGDSCTLRVVTPASPTRLDELRDEVKVRLIELESLFEFHPDALSRVVAVARRIAAVVLEPTAAERVGAWLAGVAGGGEGEREKVRTPAR